MYEFDLSKPYCYYFNEISKIPHGSYNEKAISDYVADFAKKRNLKYVQDEAMNVIIYKEASKGYEDSKPLLLEAHMDMVCEKNKSSDHDFMKDPLDLEVIDEEWLSARGTTLGSDDGYGVSYMLSILDDDTLVHPSLECCFTVEEEVGMGGVSRLDTSLFKARRMISLDGGGEVQTATSSSGGCDAMQYVPVNYTDNSSETYKLSISGLSGGHSGGQIHMEKGNSIKTAVRVLKLLELKGIKLNTVSIEGGLKRNAIPRECDVIFTSDNDYEDIIKYAKEILKDLKTELEFSDAGVNVEVNKTDKVSRHMDDESTRRLIDYIYLSINGFQHRSMAIEGLTLASLNIGVIRTEDDKVVIQTMIRSALSSYVDEMLNNIKTLAKVFGVSVENKGRYPGWNYKAESDLRIKLDKVLHEVLGKELVCQATHGGLECGVFASISEDMDIVSYGPVQLDIHTPDERLNLPSFDRAYKVLVRMLKECK
ncbi:MAG: beta-Ala-His dipeptidase [Erysipelotrichaceae bacterium]|nr:beta-Ala-His dipeptidase [Erysipelotrichaceae bacterium]